MTCAQCGAENPPNNKFCMKCGAELPVAAGTQATANQPQGAYTTAGSSGPSGPYAPPPVSPMGTTGYAPGGFGSTAMQGQLVGFGPRFVAMIIDWVVLLIAEGILRAIHLDFLVSLASILYFVYFWSTTGQTLGNMALKIKVVRTDGQPLNVTTGILRYVGYVISLVVIFLGVLWVIWDPQKQGWHDKIANTFVVRAE